MANKEICLNCKFWKERDIKHYGRCYLLPPVPNPAPNASDLRPWTLYDDFCSHWDQTDRAWRQKIPKERCFSMAGWRSIDEAILDGSQVLLFGKSGYCTHQYTFRSGYYCNGWRDEGGDLLAESGFDPTHWMPMFVEPKQ
jgi:hypothetical protein